MIRIEWDPLDASTATLIDRVVRVDGIELCDRVFDMRWLGDGQIMTFSDDNMVRWWKDGVDIARSHRGSGGLPIRAVISANGDRIALVGTTLVEVEVVPARRIFHEWLDGHDARLGLSVELSGDGTRLAVGYIAGGENRGRGFMVYDVDRGKLVDRNFFPHAVGLEDLLGLALDYPGKRLAQAVPEPVTSLGVIRVDTGEIYPRRMPGDATAVAMDRSGELVAYAYREPPDGARGRLRFDYLDRAAKGGVLVDVLDTQWLECELPSISAMAFSHDRRRLACLSLTGAIEIVPVP
ncbi:MAG: hypothetical protein QM831_00185 [Kofleriaceae bacterium]